MACETELANLQEAEDVRDETAQALLDAQAALGIAQGNYQTALANHMTAQTAVMLAAIAYQNCLENNPPQRKKPYKPNLKSPLSCCPQTRRPSGKVKEKGPRKR